MRGTITIVSLLLIVAAAEIGCQQDPLTASPNTTMPKHSLPTPQRVEVPTMTAQPAEPRYIDTAPAYFRMQQKMEPKVVPSPSQHYLPREGPPVMVPMEGQNPAPNAPTPSQK